MNWHYIVSFTTNGNNKIQLEQVTIKKAQYDNVVAFCDNVATCSRTLRTRYQGQAVWQKQRMCGILYLRSI